MRQYLENSRRLTGSCIYVLLIGTKVDDLELDGGRPPLFSNKTSVYNIEICFYSWVGFSGSAEEVAYRL